MPSYLFLCAWSRYVVSQHRIEGLLYCFGSCLHCLVHGVCTIGHTSVGISLCLMYALKGFEKCVVMKEVEKSEKEGREEGMKERKHEKRKG